jgi:DNA-binding beta-propeller fold protein YncE
LIQLATFLSSFLGSLHEPQGILYVPEFNKIFVADGGDGLCQVFDSNTFALVDQLDLSGDADNIRHDNKSRTICVGYGNGGLSLIDAATDKVLGDIQLDGHPESFQLELLNSRIFVNIPSVNQIAVVDSQKQKVIATWQPTDATANYPMALDETNHRLFVGFRIPSKLNVYNTETGKLVASLDSVGDADDIFYDALHKLIFVVGGKGNIDVISQQDADHYQLVTRIPTATGTRTGLWVPERNQLYVAVPHRRSQEAEIQVYELRP